MCGSTRQARQAIDMGSLAPRVRDLMDKLLASGFQAYLVGGCVRDLLLGRIPHDYDIATDALPEETKRIVPEVILTGFRFGTVTVPGSPTIEIATFRRDGPYLDGRRPVNVVFGRSLKEDLVRRDFTVNALAADRNGSVVDHTDGLRDLNLMVIRAVGNPTQRFCEDALRMMRAIRLACQLSFDIEEGTFRAIADCSHLISRVSSERIRDEMNRLLVSPVPSRGIEMMRETGLLKEIIPELIEGYGFSQENPHHDKDVYHHILAVMDSTPPRLIVRLAALFHDIGKPRRFSRDKRGIGHFYGHHIKSTEMAISIMKRLRYDTKTVEAVSMLVREHMSRHEVFRTKSVRRFLARIDLDLIDDLFALQHADIVGSTPSGDTGRLDYLRREVQKVINNKDPLHISDLAVDGSDLASWGIPPGPLMGRILRRMLDAVLEDPELNTKDRLKKFWTEEIKDINEKPAE